ncbi:hypothetical protein C4D60_Mb07t27330 [Musa balbisiana]|uniref:Uncharacterized protein n=1 Tax=Musa balbisiana TaxID=52838 RepID=A0A4S8JID3_MUSBA|nr:hypothetical protein C4D60_Mb07t27330 [Musa balbisiana]
MVGGGTSTQRGGHIMFPSTQSTPSQFLIASRVKNINLLSPLFKFDSSPANDITREKTQMVVLFSQLPLQWHSHRKKMNGLRDRNREPHPLPVTLIHSWSYFLSSN